jgi:hypothetical protein
VLVAACGYGLPPVAAPGQTSGPYTALPPYLQNPIGAHDLTGQERLRQMEFLLRDIDARAAVLDGSGAQDEELTLRVKELHQVVPPTPGLLGPVERMQVVMEESPRNPPADTRRRLWALTDLIRLRAHF